MIVIHNPTNELLVGWHIGIEYKLEPGAKIKVQDPTANHLLNHLGQRGLISLEFGDEGDNLKKKIDEALTKNMEFKKKQVRNHNFRNEQRKAQGLTYLPPTQQIREYASELQIELVEPYSIKVEGMAGMKDLQAMVLNQQKMIDTMMLLVNNLMDKKTEESKSEGTKKK